MLKLKIGSLRIPKDKFDYPYFEVMLPPFMLSYRIWIRSAGYEYPTIPDGAPEPSEDPIGFARKIKEAGLTLVVSSENRELVFRRLREIKPEELIEIPDEFRFLVWDRDFDVGFLLIPTGFVLGDEVYTKDGALVGRLDWDGRAIV